MTTPRLDTSPNSRLRHLAESLRLSDGDVDEAIIVGRGDIKASEAFLRSLAARASARAPIRPTAALTREDRIKRAAMSLALTPDALDILHSSLTKVLQQPHSERLRKVSVTQGVFNERVASKSTAGVELLFAVGYEPMHGHLVLQKHDAAVLELALRALDSSRSSQSYIESKAAMNSARAQQHAHEKLAAAAAARRAAHLAKVPAEPEVDTMGHRASSTCVISVRLASSTNATRTTEEGNVVSSSERVGKRRFDSDCILDDLVHYIRSLPGVPEGELLLANVTTGRVVLEPAQQGALSLFALDLWPRGQVEVTARA